MKSILRKYFPGFFPIEKITTDFNYLEVNKRHGRYVLDSEHVNYSFGTLHKVFQKAFQLTKHDLSSFKKALLLGFGAGSVAHILQKELGFEGLITGVEIDAKVIELGGEFFGLNSAQDLRIEICDAFDFVFKEQQNYDLIVVDLFIDHLIPEKFDQIEFLTQLNRLLEKGGMLLYNRMNQSFKDKNRIESFRKTCADVFKTAKLVEEFNIHSNNIIFHVKK
jgi:spermidine synthase